MANRPNIQITKVAQLRGHKDAVYNFTIDKEKRTIYSVGADGYIVAWDIDNPTDGKLILRGEEAFFTVSLMGDKLSVGSRSGFVYTMDLISNSLDSKMEQHKGGVFFVSERFSGGEDGKLALGASSNLIVSSKSLRCITENGSSYFIGSSDNRIYQLDKETLEVTRLLDGHTNSVFALSLFDKNTLVSTGRDASIKVWDLTIGKEVHSVPAHDYQAKSLSYNGRILLSSSMDKTIKLWSSDMSLLKVIDKERYEGHTNSINKVEWIDENMFVSCSDDRSLILWKVEIMP